MLSVSGFFNNLVNKLIRGIENYSTRILISVGLFILALAFLYFAIRHQPSDKPGLKIGWMVLFILALTLSVCYVIL